VIEGDHTGEETYIAMTFHPAATAAILQLAFYPINQLRVGKLKRPLARWLTTRMSHNYRQARKNSFVQNEGYHISLKTILDERGLPREARLRDNIRSVREALTEMKQRRILSEMLPFQEKLIHAPSKGRPKIVDAIWTLYPSQELVDEIIGGNKQIDQARSKVGGNKRESRRASMRCAIGIVVVTANGYFGIASKKSRVLDSLVFCVYHGAKSSSCSSSDIFA
jgi:hypothetical protein